jgi:hypothetical protein
MNVTLNIENDAELRAYIKDAIKGQVLSIVRDEFTTMIKEELERKIKGTDNRNFERMQKGAMEQAIKDILLREHDITGWRNDFIKPYINAILEPLIINKDWRVLIDTLAKEKVKSLIG